MNDNFNSHDKGELDVPSFMKNNNEENLMSHNNYLKVVKNSTSGLPVKAKAKKMMKVSKNKFKKALVTLCCTCAIFGALASTAVKSLGKAVSDSFEINSAITDYKQEAIVDNTYRIHNMQDYAYDHEKIAEHVKTDEDVYLLYANVGERNTNLVLNYVDNIDDLDSFIKNHNYKDRQEWINVSNKQILLKNEITSKQDELDQMQSEYQASINTEVASQELGGK